MSDWFKKLFIDEARPAQNRHSGNGGSDENIQEAYESGHEAGVQAERDRFWDAYQQNGTRTIYERAFSGVGWTDETFKPKYDITPTVCSQIFSSSSISNLKEALQAAGVVLDTSNATTFTQAFQYAATTHLPTIDLRKATNTTWVFGGMSYLVEIEKVIVSETTPWSNPFNYTYTLKEIRFEGTIGTNGLSFSYCSSLSLESAKSVILALKDFSGTDSEYSCSISLHANTWALLDADGNTAPDGNTWKLYAQNKGWNI